jgi:Transglutaminase-like superfamily
MSDPQTQRTVKASPLAGQLRLQRDVFLINAPDGTGWLLDLNGGFFVLNPTAVRLLRAALAADYGEVDRLAASNGTTAEHVRADQGAFVAQLLRRGLLTARLHDDLQKFPRWATLVLCTVIGRRPAVRHIPRLLLVTWVLFGRLGWQRTVAAVQRSIQPPDAPASTRFDEELAPTVREAVASCPVWVGCKERALTAAAVVWAAGRPAKVVLGVSPYPLTSHAWCEVDGRVLTDPPDRVEPFVRVAEYT